MKIKWAKEGKLREWLLAIWARWVNGSRVVSLFRSRKEEDSAGGFWESGST